MIDWGQKRGMCIFQSWMCDWDKIENTALFIGSLKFPSFSDAVFWLAVGKCQGIEVPLCLQKMMKFIELIPGNARRILVWTGYSSKCICPS